MEASVVAAWWGAIVASIVLLWDIFKWATKGARVSVNAIPNMQTVNTVEGKLDDNRLILVEALNTGDLPSTITHLVFYQYASHLNKILNKPKNQGLIPYQGAGYELPHLLNPGTRWTGNIDQNDIVKKIGEDGLFYCGVIHTARKKPVLAKINLSNENT